MLERLLTPKSGLLLKSQILHTYHTPTNSRGSITQLQTFPTMAGKNARRAARALAARPTGPPTAAQIAAREQEVRQTRLSRRSPHTARRYPSNPALHQGINHELQSDWSLRFLLDTLDSSYNLDDQGDRQDVEDIYNYATANIHAGSVRRTFYLMRDRWNNRTQPGRQHRHWGIIAARRPSQADAAVRDDTFLRILNAARVLNIPLDLTGLPVALRHLVPNPQQAAALNVAAAPQGTAANVPAPARGSTRIVQAPARAATHNVQAPARAATNNVQAPARAATNNVPAPPQVVPRNVSNRPHLVSAIVPNPAAARNGSAQQSGSTTHITACATTAGTQPANSNQTNAARPAPTGRPLALALRHAHRQATITSRPAATARQPAHGATVNADQPGDSARAVGNPQTRNSTTRQDEDEGSSDTESDDPTSPAQGEQEHAEINTNTVDEDADGYDDTDNEPSDNYDEDGSESSYHNDDANSDEDESPVRRRSNRKHAKLPGPRVSPAATDAASQAEAEDQANSSDVGITSDVDEDAAPATSTDNRRVSQDEEEEEDLYGVSDNEDAAIADDERMEGSDNDEDVVMQSDNEVLCSHDERDEQHGSDDDMSVDEDVGMAEHSDGNDAMTEQSEEVEAVAGQPHRAGERSQAVAGNTAARPILIEDSLHSLNNGGEDDGNPASLPIDRSANNELQDAMFEHHYQRRPVVSLTQLWASRQPHDYDQVLADLRLGPSPAARAPALRPAPQVEGVLDEDVLQPGFRLPRAQEPNPFVRPGAVPDFGHNMGVIRDASPELGNAMDYLNQFLEGDSDFDTTPDTTPELEQEEFSQGDGKRKDGPGGSGDGAQKRARHA
ncbi:hypothetical protein AMS68_002117 [Peltaster fructicola]|uniref:Uncharacterized protein n=1 Tax=Peltaster fructicola TaxID=286661 RepID=A0A6H0XQ46_9PEZI|nr:hypothetical protein AMS68_002117 [Peltaster fructicola]